MPVSASTTWWSVSLPRRQQRERKDSGPRLPVRLRYLLATGVLVGLIAAAGSQAEVLLAWLDRKFPVTQLAVSGDLRHQDPEVLARWLGRRVDGGFFTADLPRLQRALQERAWVREVRLRRRWPGTLVVDVMEHRAAARWRPRPSADWWLLSERGAVFRPDDKSVAELPDLEGPRARLGEMRDRLKLLVERLGEDQRVTALVVNARGDWTARLAAGITLRFGRDNWHRRLDRLVRVDRGWGLLERAVARIDLRYPDGMAVAVAEGARPKEGQGNEQASTVGLPSAVRAKTAASPQQIGRKGRI